MASQTLSLSFSLLFFALFLNTHLSIAFDTLSPGRSLSGNQTIISKTEKFELGFFQSGNSTPQRYYVGIWYKQIPKKTVVWVANRKNPVSNTSCQLKILENGNLVLLGDSESLIWSSNSTSNRTNSTVAVLLDTGNLVLRSQSNASDVIWQSFDHPTNTWLPGGKLGLNKITGENQILSSWKDTEDPSPGIFSLEIDPNESSQYYIYWNRSRHYWTSGLWNGQIFSLVPEMTANYLYDFSYVSNDRENYFTYTVDDSSIISRFVMDLSGQIQQLTWLESSQNWILLWARPTDRCEAFSLCGAFGICNQTALPFCRCLQGFEPRSPSDWNLSDWSDGCMRRTQLQCGINGSVDGQKDMFLPMQDVEFPENSTSWPASSAKDCELACLNDCSCNAYAYGSRCLIWNGNLLNLKLLSDGKGSGSNLYIRLAASELPNSGGKNHGVIGITLGAVAAVLVVICIVMLLIWRFRRYGLMQAAMEDHGSLVLFRYNDLQNATKNFSEKLGSGGFGSVFKGTLPDSTVVAVKKLEGLRQGEKQFRMEVSTIGTIQHVNLIHLRGFCSERLKRLLVYEYMPNSSLDSHLFGNKANILDWKTRFEIAIGTARGLDYLHEKCRDCIIHCDVKPENILLDGGFCPKVADFGLAKLLGREFSRVLTTMRGTRGYLAPEWLSGQAITPKADVYSYGMMLFEIISGKRNTEHSENGKVAFFPTWAAEKIAEGDVLCVLDKKLQGNANVEELSRACSVAGWCIQDDENDRPTMGLVVQILEGISTVNIPPTPRTLRIFAKNLEMSASYSGNSSDQNVQMESSPLTSSQDKSRPPSTSSHPSN